MPLQVVIERKINLQQPSQKRALSPSQGDTISDGRQLSTLQTQFRIRLNMQATFGPIFSEKTCALDLGKYDNVLLGKMDYIVFSRSQRLNLAFREHLLHHNSPNTKKYFEIHDLVLTYGC